MKSNKIINKFLVASALLLGTGLSSCEDYLTVLPSDRITEDDFWKSSSDLNNVRSAAYKQMTTAEVINRIVYWGELRSDNVAQNEMTDTQIELLRKGVLHPTNGMFNWGPFYTGINYCNKVLEKGEEMTVPGKEVDPSFRRGDWLPIKAEMLSLRALYYLNLVRAYRNVPFVQHSISTDAEALKSKIKATQGVDILGTMIDQLEDAKNFAAEDYSSPKERKGRFTKRSVHALLADIYMWRACMLQHSLEKGDTIHIKTSDGLRDTIMSQSEADKLSADHFAKVIENCDYVMSKMQEDYEEDLIENPSLADDKNRNKDYPYLLFMNTYSQKSAVDNVYNQIFGSKNSDYESVFELQYDGTVLNNSTYNTYFGSYSSGNFRPAAMVGAAEMTSSVETNYEPERGFGKSDIRLCETFLYTSAQSQRCPIHKNVVKNVIVPDIYNVAEEGSVSSNYRVSGTQDANWPMYRLSDIMLLKAEAIARTTGSDVTGATDSEAGAQLVEGFNLVNSLFKRCNPGLTADKASSGASGAFSDRLKPAKEYAKSRHASDLLKLVYNERQREFLGEGKRWYDIVRQCEYSNDVEATLSSFLTLTKEVRSRLRSMWAMYVPIYSEELKVNGVEFGGGLRQNPVWDRYTVK